MYITHTFFTKKKKKKTFTHHNIGTSLLLEMLFATQITCFYTAIQDGLKDEGI